MDRIFWNLIDWLFSARIEQYLRWSSYEIGFTGVGPTAFDKKPLFPKPWIPKFLKNRIDKEAEIIASIRHNSFRDAVLEVTGEDIDEI